MLARAAGAYLSVLSAFKDVVSADEAKAIGETVEFVKIDFDGDERRGLTATVRRRGRTWKVGLLDVAFPKEAEAARYLAAYRKWQGP